MRHLLILSALVLTTPSQADDFSGLYLGAGVGAVHANQTISVNRTTTIGGAVVNHARSYQEVSGWDAVADVAGLYQWKWGGLILGAEAAYTFRDFDLVSDASILAPGARGVTNRGDRVLAGFRLGREMTSGFLFYSGGGVYAAFNEAYVQLADGSRMNAEEGTVWAGYIATGIEYKVGPILLDLQTQVSPVEDVRTLTTTRVGIADVTYDTSVSSDWLTTINLRAFYKLN